MALGKKILFWIDGPAPTDAEKAEAEKLGTSMFRNAQAFYEGESLEDFDAVAGKVPDAYKRAYATKLEKAKMAEPMKPTPAPGAPAPGSQPTPGAKPAGQ